MRLNFFWTSGLAAALLLGCAGESPDSGPNAAPSANTDSESDSTNPSDGDGDSQPDSIPICLTGCDTAADCDLYDGQFTAYNADHYSCIDGGCSWLGCNSHAECAELQADYRCHPMPFTEFKSCVPGCSAGQDCGLPAAGILYDQDNYECNEGACVFSGCNTDAECQDSMGEASVCVDPFNIGQNNCYASCNTREDCELGGASAAYDADNFNCENGLCLYTGCRNDEECADTYEGMICFGE